MAEPFVGEIRLFGNNFAPKNWALCEGQLLAIADHQALFSLLGTTYGGDGRTNFGIPDLRGRIAVHAGAVPGQPTLRQGEKGGAEGVTLTEEQIPSHTHTMQAHNGEANMQSPNGALLASNATVPLYATVNSTSKAEMEDETTSLGGGQSHMNIQPSTVVNFCIALTGEFPQRS